MERDIATGVTDVALMNMLLLSILLSTPLPTALSIPLLTALSIPLPTALSIPLPTALFIHLLLTLSMLQYTAKLPLSTPMPITH